MTAARGQFITVEGTEGVGKSTNIEFVKQYLENCGKKLLVTREPGGTPLAEELRTLLLAKRDEAFDATAELLLVFAARAQHLNTVIRPALESGIWVLSDRFTDATFAYQGFGRGLSLQTIQQLESLVQGELQPALTLLLDIDIETGLERASARAELDRFESEELAFFQRVRSGYLNRANAEPERFAIVDAGQSLEKVQADIARQLQDKLGL